MADPPTTDDLHRALIGVSSLLDEHARAPYLSGAVRRAADEVAEGDAHGARRYLSLNRALIDICFAPANHNAGTAEQGVELQRRHGLAFDLATELLHRGIGP